MMLKHTLQGSCGTRFSCRTFAQHKTLGLRKRMHTPPRCDSKGDNKPAAASESEKFSKVLEELKKKGMTPATAKSVLKKWSELGAQDPDQLRKLLLTRSIKPVTGLLLQALLDAAASFGGFFTADIVSKSEFPGGFVLQLFGSFLGCYYFLQVVFELSAAFALVAAAYKYQANTAEVLRAVQMIAGPSTGLSVVDRAQLAVNTLKVLQTLDSIYDILKEQFDGMPPASTLQNLTAYLTLVKAKESTGFDPATYGLTESEAAKIAIVFAQYDTNENGKLDLSELKRLCQTLGKQLDDNEVKEALKILDKNGNGTVEFGEFVAWWVQHQSGGPQAGSQLASTQ